MTNKLPKVGKDYYFSSEYAKAKDDRVRKADYETIKKKIESGEVKLPEIPSYWLSMDWVSGQSFGFETFFDKKGNIVCQEIKKEDVLKKETKLPWKDVSELPENTVSPEQVLIKDLQPRVNFGIMNKGILLMDGSHSTWPASNHKALTLTDLINSIESMLSRQDELEERIKKLEGK